MSERKETQIQDVYVNRQYKDRLFKLIFRKKEDLLQLYNAINNTEYDNPEDIEVNTLEDVVYMGMKNDVSFLLTEILNLYEHQSTFSPNLPLRGMLYFARLYQKIVSNHKDIYSSKVIELPYPQFVVFYNGTKEEPERQVLKLSDAFPKGCKKENAALECQAVVLNINLGYNSSIMKKCKKLEEYAKFVAMVREYLEKYEIKDAADKAIDECIRQGILEEILRNHREEVRSMILTEYDEQAHIKNEREIALEEGRIEGEERLKKLLQHLIDTGRTEDAKRVIYDAEYCDKLYKEFGM